MPKQLTKKSSVPTRQPYLYSDVKAFSSTKINDSNLSRKEISSYDCLSAAVMFLDLSHEPAEQGIVLPVFDTEACPLPENMSKIQRKPSVKNEGDDGEEAFVQSKNRVETILVYPIAVDSCARNASGISSDVSSSGKAGENSRDLDKLLVYSSQYNFRPRTHLKIDTLGVAHHPEGNFGVPCCYSPTDFRDELESDNYNNAASSLSSDDDACVDSDYR